MSSTTWPSQGLGKSGYSDPDSFGISAEVLGNATNSNPWVRLAPQQSTGRNFLSDFTRWVDIPESADEIASPLPQMIREIRSWTGWSQRYLGEVLGTSHTTVRKLETDGTVSPKSRPAATRVPALHNLMRRLYQAAGANPNRLSVALEIRGNDGQTAIALLISENFPRAYSRALEALHGPREDMLTSGRNTPLPDATVEMI
ncbi:hypothetical protein [Streptomyces sp. NPDC049916]|uniref:helix-turn-helix domain-containing protein n=1 Tax=Streptomyces sp. NPDC049916 TaxID=3155156 RepID=UPI0034292F35